MKRLHVSLALFLIAFPLFSFANEKYEKPSYWKSRGYHEVVHAPLRGRGQETPQWPAHSLMWPVEFEDRAHSMGNSMAEFQSYGDGPYFHGGCDLRVSEAAEVRSPVEGRIEAGHYGYSNNPDGSSSKYWYPWPKTGESHYFEVAVITDDGYRFEFHHMDESRLSENILRVLKEGKGRVKPGELLGRSIPWGDGIYHHTHYNILTPSGVQLNPEYYSPLITDGLKPEVSEVLASLRNAEVRRFGDGHFSEAPDFFAVAVIDHQTENVYDHPPVLAGVEFENGKRFIWDFRERLAGPDGKFPPIWDFFVDSIRASGGNSWSTDGGYGQGLSVVRIPVPQGARGGFVLQVQDQAGNSARFEGRVGP